MARWGMYVPQGGEMDWTEYGRSKFKSDLAQVWRQIRMLEGGGVDDGQPLAGDDRNWLWRVRSPEGLASALRRLDLHDEKRFLVRLCAEALILDFHAQRHEESEVERYAMELGFASPLGTIDEGGRCWQPLRAWPDARWKVADLLLPARSLLEVSFARAIDADHPIRPDNYEYWAFLNSKCGDVPELPGYPGGELLANSLRWAVKAAVELPR